MHNELVGVLIALNLIGVALCGLILAGLYRMETRLRQDVSRLRAALKGD